MPKVRIPTPLQPAAGNRAEIDCAGATVEAVLADLDLQYPGMRARLLDEQGRLRRFLNVFVNDADIRALRGTATPLQPSDEVSIIPAIAGGGLCGPSRQGWCLQH